jgi:hypothetical protein
VSFQFGNMLKTVLDVVAKLKPQPIETIFTEKVLRGLQSDLLSVEVGRSAPVAQLKHYEECLRQMTAETEVEGYWCDHCERDAEGRHKAKCPRSAESLLQRIQEIVDEVGASDARASAWVIRAAMGLEKIRDLPGMRKE